MRIAVFGATGLTGRLIVTQALAGAAVRSSRTDWTLVRIGLLNDKAPAPVRTGRYGRGEVGLGVSRASLARFMVELASSAKYVRESPAISN